MSVSVSLEALQDEIDRHGPAAFFLSVGADGRPHCVHVPVTWADPAQLVLHPGNGTMANVHARPLATLLWPPAEPGGYSLIVDATVVATSGVGGGDNTVVVEPTKAVLHRAAEPTDPEALAHGSDCVRVFSDKS